MAAVGGGAGTGDPASGEVRRVVVVDDNALTLPGFVAALSSSPEVRVVGALHHNEAMAWTTEWRGVDAVIVDAADEGQRADQFPGVAVVRRVRASTPGARPLVIVVTGHYLHDGLRHRMAAADADFFFLRSDLRTADALVDVVLHPEHHRRGVPAIRDPEARRAIGVREGSNVDPFVDYVGQHDLERALDPDEPERDDVRSRRWARHRRDMARAGGLAATNVTTGMPPVGQSTPSIRQLRRVWAWAARVKREPE